MSHVRSPQSIAWLRAYIDGRERIPPGYGRPCEIRPPNGSDGGLGFLIADDLGRYVHNRDGRSSLGSLSTDWGLQVWRGGPRGGPPAPDGNSLLHSEVPIA